MDNFFFFQQSNKVSVFITHLQFCLFASHDFNNLSGYKKLTIKENEDKNEETNHKNPECNCCQTQITRFVCFSLCVGFFFLLY